VESFEDSEQNLIFDGMDFDVVDADQFSQLERSSIIGSSFASAFPRGSVTGEYMDSFLPIEEQKE
jgi:hypothetical protein